MSVTAVGDQVFGLVKRVIYIFRPVHCQNGGEFFVCKFFGYIDAFDFPDKDFCPFGNLHARKLGDPARFLSHDLCIESAVDDYRFSDFFSLFSVKEVTASLREFFFDRIVNLVENYHRLFGSADHSVVKGL